MIRILVQRFWQEKDLQTFGAIDILNENGSIVLSGYVIEPPDKDNKKRLSRIPQGTYNANFRTGKKYGKHIHIRGVENRSLILIHVGNYYKDTVGCMVVGYDFADINFDGLTDVTNSAKFMKDMMDLLPDKFQIKIIDDIKVEL